MLGLGWQELVIVLVIIMSVREFKQEANASTDGLATASSTGSDSIDSTSVSQSTDRAKVRADEI
jgi:hypothetical protein